MKTYWSVILAGWTTALTTMMVMKIGEMGKCSVITWDSAAFAMFLCLFPALLGYLIGREKNGWQA